MGVFLWLLLLALMAAVISLGIKLRLMRRAAGEIAKGFSEKLREDTNTLIDISSRDKSIDRKSTRLNSSHR